MSLSDYRKDKNIAPCPRCNGEVEWTNSRDLNILNSHMHCSDCELTTFNIETVLFTKLGVLPNKDYETTLMKYNTWCCTNPTSYGEENWEVSK